MKVDKTPLDLTLYESYGIDQSYSAIELIIKDIDVNDTDNIEYEYMSQGYKIFSSEMTQSNEGKFILKMICAKLSYTF